MSSLPPPSGPAYLPNYQPEPPAPAGAYLPRRYPQLLRGPGFRWWKPLVTMVLALVGFLAVQIVVSVLLFALLAATGGLDSMLKSDGSVVVDQRQLTAQIMSNPWAFLANNLGLAMLIPVAMLITWGIFRWRPSWVTSVAPGLRWRLLLGSAVVTAVVYALYFVLQIVVEPFGKIVLTNQIVLLLVMVVLTTPLQAAGEEYLFRGLLTQSIGSWFSRPVVSFVVSGVVTATAFAAVHSIGGEQNLWLWLSRFGMGLVFSYLTWRTGGLEAAIALHTVNNIFGLVPAILTDKLGEALANPPQPALAALVQFVSVLIVAVGIAVFAGKTRVQVEHDPYTQPGGGLAATNCWPT